MESAISIVPLGNLATGSLIWRPASGAVAMTVVAKLTFELSPAQCRVAGAQEPVAKRDVYESANAAGARVLRQINDLVPHKPRPDVLLIGNAYAPGGQRVTSLVTRLVVGAVEKVIEIIGDRFIDERGRVMEPSRFSTMSLDYTRAAGGASTKNPVGVDPDASGRPDGRRLPNLLPPGFLHEPAAAFIPPIGYGPLAPSWPERQGRLGALAGWSGEVDLSDSVVPPIDPAFFNSAPDDQQPEELRADERIFLEHLHPIHARLTTNLPGLRPVAFWEKTPADIEQIGMACDTLTIDTDRSIVTTVWRGQVALGEERAAGGLFVAVERSGQRLTWAQVRQRIGSSAPSPASGRGARDRTSILDVGGSGAPGADLPFSGSTAPRLDSERPSAAPSSTMPRAAITGTVIGSLVPLPTEHNLPFDGAMPRAKPAQPKRAMVEAERREPTIGEEVARKKSMPPPPIGAPPPVLITKSALQERPGVLAASNHAAGVERGVPTARAAPTPPSNTATIDSAVDIVGLLWFDARCAARIRRRWRRIVTEHDLRPIPPSEEIDSDLKEEGEDDRSRALEVLVRADAVDGQGLDREMDGAVTSSGRFEQPLVVLSGEIELPFDQVEFLQATVAMLAPFAPADRRLREAVDKIADVLKTPGLDRSESLARRLRGALKDAFSAGSHAITYPEIEAAIERQLLERRAYQRRPIYGGTWIRSLFHLPSTQDPIATYLPDSVALLLPLYARFRARAIVSCDLQQDPAEPSRWACRGLALARVHGRRAPRHP